MTGEALYERYVAGNPVHMLAIQYLNYDTIVVVAPVQTSLEVAHRP
jgi:hypothetical protein